MEIDPEMHYPKVGTLITDNPQSIIHLPDWVISANNEPAWYHEEMNFFRDIIPISPIQRRWNQKRLAIPNPFKELQNETN